MFDQELALRSLGDGASFGTEACVQTAKVALDLLVIVKAGVVSHNEFQAEFCEGRSNHVLLWVTRARWRGPPWHVTALFGQAQTCWMRLLLTWRLGTKVSSTVLWLVLHPFRSRVTHMIKHTTLDLCQATFVRRLSTKPP